jgi:CubicO group peptidase (beta-lactamase class C family)
MPAVAALPAAQALQIERVVRKEMRAEGIPGLALAVVQDGQTIYARGFGVAEREHQIPVTSETVFQIGSIGKQFTATVATLLAREGRLDLDAPLSRYVDGLPTAWSTVTPRRVLVHQAGVPQIAPPDRDLLDLSRDYSVSEYVALATSLPLDFEPGTGASYSDTGYVLLGFALDRAGEQFYGDFLHEHVFGPLGMHSTRIVADSNALARRAHSYERGLDGHLHPASWVSPTLNRTADGSLYSTVRDLARWDAAIGRHEILTRPELEALWVVPALQDGTAPLYHYGSGWERNRLRELRVIEYDGTWQGFHGAMVRYDEIGLSVIVLSNAADTRAQRIAHDVAGYINPQARPYRRGGADPNPACGAALAAKVAAALTDTSDPLGAELRSVGPIVQIGYAETLDAAHHEAVYLVAAVGMDEWIRVRCGPGMALQVLDLYREF